MLGIIRVPQNGRGRVIVLQKWHSNRGYQTGLPETIDVMLRGRVQNVVLNLGD